MITAVGCSLLKHLLICELEMDIFAGLIKYLKSLPYFKEAEQSTSKKPFHKKNSQQLHIF